MCARGMRVRRLHLTASIPLLGEAKKEFGSSFFALWHSSRKVVSDTNALHCCFGSTRAGGRSEKYLVVSRDFFHLASFQISFMKRKNRNDVPQGDEKDLLCRPWDRKV